MKQTKVYRLLLVDRDPALAVGLPELINREPWLQIVDVASNAEQGLTKALSWQPDLVLLDLNLPGGGGLKLARQISQLLPEVKIVFLSSLESQKDLLDAIAEGYSGFCLKGIEIDELLEAIRAALNNTFYFEPRIFTQFRTEVDRLRNLFPFGQQGEASLLEEFTPRQKDVLELLVQGKKEAAIAEELQISYYTARTHVNTIKNKLGVQTKAEAIYLCWRMGLVYQLSASSVDFNGANETGIRVLTDRQP